MAQRALPSDCTPQGQLIGHVKFVDVAHACHRFLATFFATTTSRSLNHLSASRTRPFASRDVCRACVVAREREKRPATSPRQGAPAREARSLRGPAKRKRRPVSARSAPVRVGVASPVAACQRRRLAIGSKFSIDFRRRRPLRRQDQCWRLLGHAPGFFHLGTIRFARRNVPGPANHGGVLTSCQLAGC
jgi:hypothetical protein